MTSRANIFRKFAWGIFSVFVLNALASFFYWYQSFNWFDNMMHFFGGVVSGLFIIWLFYKAFSIWLADRKIWQIIFITTVTFLLIAILWELMEFSVQDIFDIEGVLATPRDSLSDIIFGLIGSFTALTYYFLRRKNVSN